MKKMLMLTGVTNNPGKVFVEYLGKNIELINTIFPGGVKAICRESSNISDYERQLPLGQKYISDLKDVDRLKIGFQGVDTLFHIAGIHWSKEVFEAAIYNGVRRIISVHTCGIYSKYKAAGEEYRQIDDYCYKICKENGVILTILRPTMIYGNKYDRNIIKFIKMVDKFPIMPVVNGGRYEVQPVNYKDLGKAFYDVLINEDATANKDFILSGKSPIFLRDMLSEIGNNLGKNVKFVSCPYWIAYPGAVGLYFISFKKIDLREKVQRLCEPRAFEHKEATMAFGFNPCSFASGIKEEVLEYMKK